jgi:hypothetical protein
VKYFNSDGSPAEIVSLNGDSRGYRIVFAHDPSTLTARADYFDSTDSLVSYYLYAFENDFRELRYANYNLSADTVTYDVEFRYPSDTLKQSGLS